MYTMPSKAIPVKLGEDVIESIDELVKKGLCRSRNEAIRQILGKGLVTFSNEVGTD